MTDQTIAPLRTTPITADLAPLPKTEAEVTIGGLARHEAVNVYALMCQRASLGREAFGRNPVPGALERYAAAAEECGAWFSVLFLLRALVEHAPDAADEVARELWQFYEGEDDGAEYVADWLLEYGIDPERVIRLAEKQRAEQAAAS